ncbi:acylphosphatase [Gilvimarinus xylanilyticus]|uniref:acylphosphatase n=1 Tax=Gilvimarinus xylanilyticus TaxID=2944139 RepID=A0A9X2HYE7_9GAMM|nr:acylphosphatase [Gilvimarinus xylanilyticus]MCP8900004.1 acylphosphatase [Gilvimarinus xylanilyticus]
MLSKRFYVSGRVQGVSYRASTQAEAQALGVTGWARNLHDGRVEVLATAPDDKMARLAEWLHRGPARAQVKSVEAVDIPTQDFAEFSIYPDA